MIIVHEEVYIYQSVLESKTLATWDREVGFALLPAVKSMVNIMTAMA